MFPSLELRVKSSDVMKCGSEMCVIEKYCSEKEGRKEGGQEEIKKERIKNRVSYTIKQLWT